MVKVNRFIFWTPRIFLILFALFLAIFSLDVFGNDYTFLETVVGLFMHNLPSLVLLVILIISWKYDLVGAIIFMTLGIVCVIGTVIALLMLSSEVIIFPLITGGIINPMFIIASVVFLLIGILFLASWKQKKKLGKNIRLSKHKRKRAR